MKIIFLPSDDLLLLDPPKLEAVRHLVVLVDDPARVERLLNLRMMALRCPYIEKRRRKKIWNSNDRYL